MNALANRLQDLEARFERQRLLDQAAFRQLAALAAAPPVVPSYGGSSGGVVYSMVGVVIAAGVIAAPGSVTGATVYALVGGAGTVVSTNATIFNQMQAATVASKTIMLGSNP